MGQKLCTKKDNVYKSEKEFVLNVEPVDINEFLEYLEPLKPLGQKLFIAKDNVYKSEKGIIFKLDVEPGDINECLEPMDKTMKFKYLQADSCQFEHNDLYKFRGNGIANMFLNTILHCYDKHLPVCITPDMIKYQILLGFGKITTNNPEKYKEFFTDSLNKIQISVRDDNFVLGHPENDWPRVIETFVQKIKDTIKDPCLFEYIQYKFSTTSAVNTVCNNIATLDAVSPYFECSFQSCCGFPQVELQGTVDDWLALKEFTLKLGEHGMAWWTDPLQVLLDGFVETARGNIDKQFWNSLVKYSGMSGGPFLTGHLCRLIPIHQGQEVDWSKDESLIVHEINTDTCIYKFNWQYLDRTIPMAFVSKNVGATLVNGHVSVSQAYFIGRMLTYEKLCKAPSETCTFHGKEDYIYQDWVNCDTCFPGLTNKGVCMGCAKTCHDGHKLLNANAIEQTDEIFKPNHGRFFCDCNEIEICKEPIIDKM